MRSWDYTDTPVLDSDEVADEAIGCTALHKVFLSGEKSLRVSVAKLPAEVVEQRAGILLLDLVQ